MFIIFKKLCLLFETQNIQKKKNFSHNREKHYEQTGLSNFLLISNLTLHPHYFLHLLDFSGIHVIYYFKSKQNSLQKITKYKKVKEHTRTSDRQLVSVSWCVVFQPFPVNTRVMTPCQRSSPPRAAPRRGSEQGPWSWPRRTPSPVLPPVKRATSTSLYLGFLFYEIGLS